MAGVAEREQVHVPMPRIAVQLPGQGRSRPGSPGKRPLHSQHNKMFSILFTLYPGNVMVPHECKVAIFARGNCMFACCALCWAAEAGMHLRKFNT